MVSITGTSLTGNQKLDAEIKNEGQELKWEVVMQVLKGQINKTEAAALAGVSRPTIYKWLHGFVHGALDGLKAQRPGPKVNWKLSAGN